MASNIFNTIRQFNAGCLWVGEKILKPLIEQPIIYAASAISSIPNYFGFVEGQPTEGSSINTDDESERQPLLEKKQITLHLFSKTPPTSLKEKSDWITFDSYFSFSFLSYSLKILAYITGLACIGLKVFSNVAASYFFNTLDLGGYPFIPTLLDDFWDYIGPAISGFIALGTRGKELNDIIIKIFLTKGSLYENFKKVVQSKRLTAKADPNTYPSAEFLQEKQWYSPIKKMLIGTLCFLGFSSLLSAAINNLFQAQKLLDALIGTDYTHQPENANVSSIVFDISMGLACFVIAFSFNYLRRFIPSAPLLADFIIRLRYFFNPQYKQWSLGFYVCLLSAFCHTFMYSLLSLLSTLRSANYLVDLTAESDSAHEDAIVAPVVKGLVIYSIITAAISCISVAADLKAWLNKECRVECPELDDNYYTLFLFGKYKISLPLILVKSIRWLTINLMRIFAIGDAFSFLCGCIGSYYAFGKTEGEEWSLFEKILITILALNSGMAYLANNGAIAIRNLLGTLGVLIKNPLFETENGIVLVRPNDEVDNTRATQSASANTAILFEKEPQDSTGCANDIYDIYAQATTRLTCC